MGIIQFTQRELIRCRGGRLHNCLVLVIYLGYMKLPRKNIEWLRLVGMSGHCLVQPLAESATADCS